MSEMLQQLANECSNALEWSSESEAITADTATAFESLVAICRDAGLVIADMEDGEQLNMQVMSHDAEAVAVNTQQTESRLAIEIPSPGFAHAGVSSRDPVSMRSCAPTNSGAWTPRRHTGFQSNPTEHVVDNSDHHYVASPVRREEIIEIELTDLLTHTHEEIELCRRELSEQLHQAERRCADAQTQSRADLQVLHSAHERSQETMTRIQQDVQDTRQSMTALQNSVLQSQQAMEAAMKDQARQWKAICNDLIVEKRNVAKKLAEERGKCAALKEHLAMHDNQRHSPERRCSPDRKQEGYGRAESSRSRLLSDLESEDNATTSPVCPASPLLAVLKKSSVDNDFKLLHVDLYSNGNEEFLSSSALRSPSSLTLSCAESVHYQSKAYSLTRKLTSSELSTSPTSNSGHRSHLSAASSNSSRSRKSDATFSSSSPAVKLESLSGRTSAGRTASFRRYYLSSQQLPSAISSRRNSNSISREQNSHSADAG